MTPFYRTRFVNPFPIPLLALERLKELQQVVPEEPWEDLLVTVLQECCGVSVPTQEDIDYLQNRLYEIEDEFRRSQKDAAPDTPNRSFGRALQDMLHTMNLPQLLLTACEFDTDRARHLYCDVDRSEAMLVVTTWIEMQSHTHNLRYEAGLYATGNRYQSDRPQSQVIDLRQGMDADELNTLMFH